MEVERYLFQSPSPHQVQIGRPDPTVQKDESSTGSNLTKSETQTKAESFAQSQKQEVKPSITPNSIDLYV